MVVPLGDAELKAPAKLARNWREKMKKEKRTYPRTVWVLTPSFKPKQVTVVRPYSSWSSTDYGDSAEGGKCYSVADMHATLDDAIKAGRAALVKAQADVSKRQETVNKKAAQLDKAESAK